MKEKPRFIVDCNIDKEYKECEFKIEDSWASRYGAIVTFHLPYPYTQSQLDKELKEAKIALRKDYDNIQREGRTLHRFVSIVALMAAIILAIVISQAL